MPEYFCQLAVLILPAVSVGIADVRIFARDNQIARNTAKKAINLPSFIDIKTHQQELICDVRDPGN